MARTATPAQTRTRPTTRTASASTATDVPWIAVARPLPPGAVHPKNRDVWVCNETGQSRFWQVVYRKAVVQLFGTQRDAVRYGIGLATEKKTELVICRPNGKIRRKVSYGHDSKRRKG